MKPAPGLELRYRQHARVEDRIREAKAAGLANLPQASPLTPTPPGSKSCWPPQTWSPETQLIGFTDTPELARCEIHAFRYRVLHVAARITRGARQLRLRIDATSARPAPSHPPGTASEPYSSPDRQTSPDHHRPERPRPQERPPTRRHGQPANAPHTQNHYRSTISAAQHRRTPPARKIEVSGAGMKV